MKSNTKKRIVIGIATGITSIVALITPAAAALPYRGLGSITWLMRWFGGWF